MKKTNLYLIVLSVFLSLTGCADENTFGTSFHEGEYSLLATIEGQEADPAGSRTAVGESGEVTWIDTDALGVFAAHTDNAKFVSKGNGASVSFAGNLAPADENAEWAYYPYSADAECNGKTLSFTLPSEYVYTGNSNAPMIGVKNTDGSFVFNHLCGLIRFTLGGGIPQGADRFVITSVGDDAPVLAGQATIADVHADKAVLTIAGEGSRSITYTLNGLATAGEYQHFFVPLPVGTYGKLQVAFYLKDKTEPEFTRTLSNLEVKRAVMTSMPVLDWKTGEQFVLGENTLEITDALAKQVSVSPEKNTTLLYKDAVADQVPELGNIVWSRMSEHFPDGFLGKVTKVTKNPDGSYSVETGVAALTEAFEELYINETVELKPENATSAQARGWLDFNDIKNEKFGKDFEWEVEKEQEDGPFYASGKIEGGAELTVNISFKNRKIETAKLGLITSVGLSGEAGVKISAEKETELLKKQLSSLLLPPIPLAGGLIQVTPTMTPYLLGKAGGEIVNNIEFSTKIKNEFHAEYINGKWASQSEELPSASSDAPWHLGGSLSFKGELSISLYNEFNIKLYNRDDMKLFVGPEIGAKLSGELKINDTNASSLDQILNDAKLSSCLYLGGSIGLDASLLVPGDLETKIEIEPFEFCKREIPLFRAMSQLFAKLNDDKEEEPLKADVHMEAAGPQLIKEAEMAIALENEAKEIIATSEPVDCDAVVGNEIKEDPIPIQTTFENLKPDVQYTSYPVIQSPILKEIVPEGRLELRFNEVSFKASGSIREQLIQLYNSTGGDNWTNNENWCTDKPIDTWYGIHRKEGKYEIYLSDNNLTGKLALSSPDITAVVVDRNNLTDINVSDCTNLTKLMVYENPLSTLDISNTLCSEIPKKEGLNYKVIKASGCKNLTGVGFSGIQLESLDISGCENVEGVSLTDVPLEVLNAANCKKLRGLTVRSQVLRSLDVSYCEALESSPIVIAEKFPLEKLNVSGCKYEQSFIHITPIMKELYANDCESLEYVSSDRESPCSLRILETKNCPNLKQIDCINNQLSLLDASGCSALESVSCENENNEIKQGSLTLRLDGCVMLKDLECRNSHLSELDLTDCVELENLNCFANNLSLLDVSNNANLLSLDCANNPMASLDVSHNRRLTYLYCGGYTGFHTLHHNNPELHNFYCSQSGLTSLDLSKYKKLEWIQCVYNDQLKSLNLFGCTGLKHLFCNNSQLTELDIHSCSVLEECNCCDNQITSLNVGGITSLTRLDCGNNLLSSLDISKTTSLTYFNCYNNLLSSLDIAHLKDCLQYLSCGSNRLTAPLDVSGFTALTIFDYAGNQIESVNATGCISLEQILDYENSTKQLILKNCSSLTSVDIRQTPLEVLDLSGCAGLKRIFLQDVLVTALDISASTQLETLNCTGIASLSALTLPASCPNIQGVGVEGTKILHEIPDWFPKNFSYEQRYTDYKVTYDKGEKVVTYTDKGYGWWYPGEPDKGYHR